MMFIVKCSYSRFLTHSTILIFVKSGKLETSCYVKQVLTDAYSGGQKDKVRLMDDLIELD